MRILLTGESGFVGSRIKEYIKSTDNEYWSIPSESLKKVDEYKIEEAISKLNPDMVIHTAAISRVDYCENNPNESYKANVELPVIMAKLCEKYHVKLISCSSDQVYSGNGGDMIAQIEDRILAPSNVYGRHKLEAEKRINDIADSAVSLRLTWMYDMPLFRTHSNGGYPMMLINSLLHNKKMEFYTSDYRGLTYVREVAKNILKTYSIRGGAYNYGCENSLNAYDTAVEFLNAMGLEDRIEDSLIKVETDNLRSLSMNCSKLKDAGIVFCSTAQSVKEMIKDYKY